ncbi:MAG: MFS transporter [Actinomycetota bacterium]|nr:MFS transporter [Actinomycetota bacterium]
MSGTRAATGPPSVDAGPTRAPALDDQPGGEPRFFYGWVVVAAVFVMLAVSSGLGFYGLTVYLRALSIEHSFSIGAVSAATALFFLVTGVVGLPVASLIGRHDPRPTIAAGAVCGGLALLLLGRVNAVWQVYPAYALFGFGFAASSLVPGTTLVTRWFSRRRSMALSVASTGLSAGGVLITPVVAAVVTRFGIATAAPWLALAYVLGIVPVTALLMRSHPASMGLQPDGDHDGQARMTAAPGTPAAAAVRTRFFWAVTVAHLLAMLCQVGGIAHLYNLVAERGSSATAATAVSVLAVASLLGRLAGGWVVTRVPMRAFTAALMVAQAVSLGALAAGHSPLTLLVAAGAFGITVGNLLMLHPLLLAERFGVRDYGKIYSRSSVVATLGIASGPFVLGLLHDLLGGYGVALSLVAILSLLAALALRASGPVHLVHAAD